MLKQFLKDEQGQTTVEYLLIIAVIVVGVAALGGRMKKAIEGVSDKVFQGVTKQVDTLMNAAAGR